MAALLKPGDLLGKYEIMQELAVGGMASIFLARVRGTAGFEKNVVLKCILPSLAMDRQFVAMFLDEARLAATLRHSNIADVFDVGSTDQQYYFAMEYVHGQNARTLRLEAREKQIKIPIEIALATVIGTASALAYAHDKTGPEGPLNLVHRDVSPSNILVSYDGAVKLVDFGIARASLRSGSRTRTGMRKGKVPYMSPEQCRGLHVDRRSDLFSLGTVLYELTTPQRPFVGNSDFEVMDAIVSRDPPPPSRLVPGYPIDLERIVLRLLARDPEARYPHGHALLEDLEGFASSHGILTSSHVVARYMRELFLDPPLAQRDTYTDFAQPSGARTKPYTPARGSFQPDEEPTGAFRPSHLRKKPHEIKVTFKPRNERASTQRGDEPSVTAPFQQEMTRQDARPIDERFVRTARASSEMIDELDNGAPANESPEQRACRRVDTLIHQAMAWLALGDALKAVDAIELALDEAPTSERAADMLQEHVETIVEIYEAMLEDPYRRPHLTRTQDELAYLPLEDDARILLPLIDGATTIVEMIERSGLQRLEVYHHLCQLQRHGLMQ